MEKKGYLSQTHMLHLQKVLMLAATISALSALQHVNPAIALLSCVLHLTHRHLLLLLLLLSLLLLLLLLFIEYIILQYYYRNHEMLNMTIVIMVVAKMQEGVLLQMAACAALIMQLCIVLLPDKNGDEIACIKLS